MAADFMMREQDIARVQLLTLMEEAFASELSFNETHRVQTRLADLLLSITDEYLYETGVIFRRWLDDWDIRQRDGDYAESTTSKLKDRYRVVLVAAEPH